MFSAPELLVHSPSFPVRGGNNKHAEMWHLGTATRFLLGIYKLENNRNTLPMPLSQGLLHRARSLWNRPWPLGECDLHLDFTDTHHLLGLVLLPEMRAEREVKSLGIKEIHSTQIWRPEPQLLWSLAFPSESSSLYFLPVELQVRAEEVRFTHTPKILSNWQPFGSTEGSQFDRPIPWYLLAHFFCPARIQGS